MKSHTDFYSAAATIIPVLFLVFAVQNTDVLRVKITRQQSSRDVLFGMAFTMIILTLGEASALAGLLGLDNLLTLALIIFGVGISVEQVVVVYLTGEAKKLLDEAKSEESWSDPFNKYLTYQAICLTYLAMALPILVTFAAFAAVAKTNK
jgi:hypothetical protein